MAIYNTGSDAANTAVRAFLTQVGEHYLGSKFNTASGKGKAIWLSIRDEVFEGKCAYCGTSSATLQIEHLMMFNRAEYGLHHPGNIVPCCKLCNKRNKNLHGEYLSWKDHLHVICEKQDALEQFQIRKKRIEEHISNFDYPNLNDNERHAIRVIANSLYENIKAELEKSKSMYKQLDSAFVRQSDTV